MADSSKAQKLKLANSRKRFKELQELKKKNTMKKFEHNSEDVISIGPTSNSVTSSTPSPINHEQVEESILDNFTQLPTYFKNIYPDKQQTPAMFFDTILQKDCDLNNQKNFYQENVPNQHLNSVSSSVEISVKDPMPAIVDTNATYNEEPSEKYFDKNDPPFPHFIAASQDIMQSNQGVLCENDPEKIQDELDSQNLIGCLRDVGIEEISDRENVAIKEEITDFSNQAIVEVQHSSVESLRQLSDQMAQLLTPDYSKSSSITDLEKRNLELAAILEQEKRKSEQQNLLTNELEIKVAQLDELIKQKEFLNSQLQQKLGSLKEELQSHIQTIGMLVAEKTELSANLNQFEFCSKQKSEECEELNARLKASRARVADLEREINTRKLEKKQNENTVQGQNELTYRTREENNMLKEQKEQVVQDLLETREKLNNSCEVNVILQQQNQELSSKLSLAHIKIQQMTNGEQLQITNQLEKISQEKFDLQKQVSDLKKMLKTVTKERSESDLQYQQYTQQQNIQLASLSNKIEQLQLENNTLLAQEQNRIKHISDLERQLQNLQTEQVSIATDDTNLRSDFENSREFYVQLQNEKTAVEEDCMKITNEKEMLLQELEAKNDSIAQLEYLLEQLRGNQPDSVKLLATMESDKIAAARAVQQNKQMKQQIESMEEVFLKLNNDKVKLTEQLNREICSNKELLEKLQKTELHVQRLTDAIEIKDRELSHLQKNTTQLNKQILKDELLSDRLRHFEAQDNCSHVIKKELEEAKQVILKLTNEIHLLKHNINKEQHNSQIVGHSDVNLMSTKLEEICVKRSDLKTNLQNLVDNSNTNNIQDDNYLTASSQLDREIAMRHLENKFKHIMKDIADLTEEKQRLEHLVLQLQGETETIGEYVALYQHQRMVLKQKTLEKDQQLNQLATDREQMKNKLEKLNKLIKKLVTENGTVPAELLQQHKNVTSQSMNFCEEHCKIHDEMCKVNDGQFPILNNPKNSETAEEIIALLLDIKSSNLVQTNENIHHCAWCSGQLITV